jgi:hypothetical protein
MPDPVHRSVVVTQLVNKLLQRGKRSLSEKIVYDALTEIERKTGTEPVATVKRAVENVRPVLEVKSRRVGGATYQVVGGGRAPAAHRRRGPPAHLRTPCFARRPNPGAGDHRRPARRSHRRTGNRSALGPLLTGKKKREKRRER